MSSTVQRLFSKGEVSPSIGGRADLTAYQSGLRTLRNFFVGKSGGVYNRPGTEFTCETKNSALGAPRLCRLLKFVFNAEQTYALLLEPFTARVIKGGALVEVGTLDAWDIGTTYAQGDQVSYSGVNYYGKLDDNTGNQPDISTPYWHAMTGDTFEFPTPYAEADLATLNYVQSGDIVTIVHRSYPPMELRRTGDAAWTLTAVDFSPPIARPVGLAATGGPAGTIVHNYRVTASTPVDYREGLCGHLTAGQTITGATNADPVVVTAVAHGFADGDLIYIKDVVGMDEINDHEFYVNVLDADTFQLRGIDGTVYGSYTSGGTAHQTYATVTKGVPTAANPIVFSWDETPGVYEYNVYKEGGAGVFGYIGTSTRNSWSDDGSLAPDTADTQPQQRNPFEFENNWPGTTNYFQQRHLYASTNNEPEKVFASKTGDFPNFTIRSPLTDNDAITFNVSGRQVNQVRHLVEIGRLVMMTSGGEWTADELGPEGFVPGGFKLTQQSYNGCSVRSPIVIEANALYVQARGSVIRDLRYSFETDGYAGNDLTVFAFHLFEGYTVEDWDYAQIPHSIVWACRSDGTLLGLTYLRDHQIWGWHRHDTQDGLFENVCVIPEGDEDAVYVVVLRTIDGVEKRYVERFASRRISDLAADAFFVDSGLTYDGRNTGLTTLTLSGSYLGLVVSDGPEHYVRLGETGGATVADSIAGGPYTVDNNVDPAAGLIESDADGAMLFDGGGAGSLVNLGTQGALGSTMNTGATFEFWVKTTSGGKFVGKTDDTDGKDFYISITGSQVQVAVFSGGGSNNLDGISDGSAPDLEDGLPHHVVVYIQTNSDTIRVWTDAVERTVAYFTQTTPVYIDFVDAVFLGAQESGFGDYAGVGDEFAWYAGLLPLESIQAHYAAGTGGQAWTQYATLILSSSASQFIAGDVGNEYVLFSGDDVVRAEVTDFISATEVQVRVDQTVPESLRDTATTDWARAVDVVIGLDHLDGMAVTGLAEGNVLPVATVSGGSVTLPRPFYIVHVGLPIQADFETLDLENTGQGPTLIDKTKRINRVTLLVEASRGIFAGTDEDHLIEYKQRATEQLGEPIDLLTGPAEVVLTPTWNNNGRVFVRQSEPIPLGILSIVPSGFVGD